MIKLVSSVELLGFQIDHELTFNRHISKICKSVANQLNALRRLKQFLSFHAKEVLINSYIISNFNYCPLVWMFSSTQSLNKIGNLQKRALRLLYDDFEASYEDLLSKGRKPKMNVRRLRTLCVEIYKTLNDLNPSFMKNIFKLKINAREYRDKYKLNLDIPKWNQKTLGYKSLKVLGPKIWKNFPYHVKSSDNLNTFKKILKNWDGNLCNCTLCNNLFSKIYILQYYLFSLFYF